MTLSLTLKNYIPTEYLDYIIIAGQSNMNGRVPHYYYYEGEHVYLYNFAHPVVKSYNIDTNTLDAYNPIGTLEHFDQPQPGNISWGNMLAFDLYNSLPNEYKFISVSHGATSCAVEWKKDTGYLYNYLKNRINAFKAYALSQNKIARCRLILWDQKESDADIEFRSLNYCYDDGGILKGNFVDFYDGICEVDGNANIPIVFAEQMSTQQDVYYTNIITAQNLFADRVSNAYLLPMEINNTSIPLQDQWHYSNIGQTFVRNLALNTILENNLLNNWK